MDGDNVMKILKFKAGTGDAQKSLFTVNQMALAWWGQQGYTITDGQLVGKKNGIDAPESTLTISWSEIKTSPDGEWEYYSSLSNDERFLTWKTTYDEFDGVEYEEITLPDGWKLEEIDI